MVRIITVFKWLKLGPKASKPVGYEGSIFPYFDINVPMPSGTPVPPVYVLVSPARPMTAAEAAEAAAPSGPTSKS
jgi:hypothetical protein